MTVQPSRAAAAAEVGISLMPAPSRRSTGSASATINCFWLSVSGTSPIVESPPAYDSRSVCRNVGSEAWTVSS
ncbi:hypothetical protein KAE78_04110 [Microbacterium sp. NIBRBAC000506063]|nr:hypothetical protein KAE78_04110 [Microbacterium sp. NIBRBAC000506063]